MPILKVPTYGDDEVRVFHPILEKVLNQSLMDMKLQEEFDLTYLFIAHDLSMVRHISDRVAVMYLGQIMELASYDELYNNPLHPYTVALLSAIPVADPEIEENRKQIILEGDVPSPANPPSGCPFCNRCPLAIEICHKERPNFKEVRSKHYSACHRVDESGVDLSQPSINKLSDSSSLYLK